MAGRWSPGTPPPEVPEEFAAAYRAAYERAMAAQAAAPHGAHADRDPSGSSAPEPEEEDSTGASVAFFDDDSAAEEPGEPEPEEPEAPEREEPDDLGAPTFFERVRDSGWLVPLLLVLLAMLLVAGAYALGRVFSGRVGETDARASVPHLVVPAPPHQDPADPVRSCRLSL